MIFNCVRSNELGQIGFLKDIRRLNVGLTRSKHFLFMIGNSKTLLKNKIWGDFIR
jgi:senataxin